MDIPGDDMDVSGDIVDLPQVERAKSSDSSIPLEVKLVGYWEFTKAACAIAIFCCLWVVHNLYFASGAVGQDPLSNPAVQILPLAAVYMFIVGFGVWNLMKWTRFLLLPAIAYWAPPWVAFWAALHLPPKSDRALLGAILPRPLALLLMALDIVAVLMLLTEDARRAFDGDVDPDLAAMDDVGYFS